MTEKIRAYYQEHKSVFEENFRMVLDSFNMEAIHKMRTSTKRLRALFILMEFLTNKKFKAAKQLKKIRILFRYAGHIREIQIEQQLVIDLQEILHEDYSEYIEYLKRREHREIIRFLKHLPPPETRETILNDAKINAAFEQLDQQDNTSRAKEYVRAKETRISGLIAKPASNKRIHTNRTHLKQLYYLYEILTDLTNEDMLLGITNERIREIEQFFGDWHDLVNSPVYMNAFLKTRKIKGEKKYAILKKEIADKRRLMRREITTSIYPEIRT
jgi:CHAD domain-containing protein